MEKIWVIYKIDGNTGRETLADFRSFTNEQDAYYHVKRVMDDYDRFNTYYAKPFVPVEGEE